MHTEFLLVTQVCCSSKNKKKTFFVLFAKLNSSSLVAEWCYTCLQIVSDVLII